MKKKTLPLFLSALVLLGAVAPVTMTSLNGGLPIQANALAINETQSERNASDLHLIRDVVAKIVAAEAEEAKTLAGYKTLVNSTNEGLPIYENEGYTPTLKELKATGMYFAHLSKFAFEDILLYNEDTETSVIDYAREFLDGFMQYKDNILAFIEGCNIENPSTSEITELHEKGKIIYTTLMNFLNKVLDPEETDPNAYKTYLDKFKTYVNDHLDVNLDTSNVNAFKGVLRLVKKVFANLCANSETHLVFLKTFFDESLAEYLNRENVYTEKDPNLLTYTQATVDEIEALPEEQRIKAAKPYIKGAFRSLLEFTTIFLPRFNRKLTNQNAKAFINNCGPILYKVLDLFESYKNLDYINTMIIGLDIRPDIYNLYDQVFAENEADGLNYPKAIAIARIGHALKGSTHPEFKEAAKKIATYINDMELATNDDKEAKVKEIKGLANMAISSLTHPMVVPRAGEPIYHPSKRWVDEPIYVAAEMIDKKVPIDIPPWYTVEDGSTAIAEAISVDDIISEAERLAYDDKVLIDYAGNIAYVEAMDLAIKEAEKGEISFQVPFAVPIHAEDAPYLKTQKVYAIDTENQLHVLEELVNANDLPTANCFQKIGNYIHIYLAKKIKSVRVASINEFKVADALTDRIELDVALAVTQKDQNYAGRTLIAAPIRQRIAEDRVELAKIVAAHPEDERVEESLARLTVAENELDSYVGEVSTDNNKNAVIVAFSMITPILLGFLVAFIALFVKEKKKKKQN